LIEKNAGLFRFVKGIIAFRLRHHGFMRPEFYTGRDGNYNAIPDICWYDEEGETPEWDKLGYCLALRMDGSKADILADRDDNDFFIMFNAGLEPADFRIAEVPEGKIWVRAVDTGLPSPEDILDPGNEKPLMSPDIYRIAARSMVILVSKA
ncbi:MAG: glycogen debranching enzyme, partial [Treponema sp.]|nr:glycogen debranching enzyme [Treponema sp.]